MRVSSAHATSFPSPWVTRAYAIGIGAGTQVLTCLLWFMLVEGKLGELPRIVTIGAGWAINMVFAEWILRRGRIRPTSMFAPAG